MHSFSYAAILAAMCCPLDAYAAGDRHFIPDCARVVKIAHAQVTRVEQDGTLRLSDGRVLWLEGIRLPASGENARALAVLRGLVSGPVDFTAVTPENDRYGRIRVQGFGRSWMQVALLEQGLAWVQIAPDRAECAPDLYEAEARARQRRGGIWASPDYRVRAPSALADRAGRFQLVEGAVGHIGRAEGRTFIDFEADSSTHRPLSLIVESRDRRAFRDFDFDDLSGRHIRVRGIVQTYRGRPEIALSNPFQIEVLD